VTHQYQKSILLASASPRRRELIRHLGVTVEIDPSHVSEDTESHVPPEEMVAELALRKAAEIAARRPDAVVIGADTTVEIEGSILNKPADLADAERMLRLLRGRAHLVHTGVAVIVPDQPTQAEVMTSRVTMRSFPDTELRSYLETRESLDKAGAYGIQGAAGDIVDSVVGCYTNVVGLPLCSVARCLLGARVQINVSTPRCGLRDDRICPWWPVPEPGQF
jgi:septum formation protein